MSGFLVFPLLVLLGSAGVFAWLVKEKGFKDASGRVIAFGVAVAAAFAALFAGIGAPPAI